VRRPGQRPQGRRVQRPGQRPQRLHDRGVGQPAAAELDATADQHPGARRLGPCRQLGDEAGLADAGLAAEQDDRRLARAGTLEGRLQPAQLLGPSDEDRAAHPLGHAAIMAQPGRATVAGPARRPAYSLAT